MEQQEGASMEPKVFVVVDRDTWPTGEPKRTVHIDGCRDITREQKSAPSWADRVMAFDADHAVRTYLDEVLGMDMDDEAMVADEVLDFTVRPCAKAAN